MWVGLKYHAAARLKYRAAAEERSINSRVLGREAVRRENHSEEADLSHLILLKN